tara:strand:+ start:84 stop:677 length:594 start_codon:yes stop_codon:yes gene_type:complete
MTEHKNIHIALCAAQTGMGKVTKGATNPAFKSKYANLSDVVSVAIPALSEQGIAMYHTMVRDEHGSIMRTILAHGVSDTSIYCDVPLIINKNDMQGMKSATTYAKRIGLESLTGIAPEDDDGNAAAKAPPKEEAPKLITEDQFRELNDMMFDTETDEEKFCAYMKVETIEMLNQKQFKDAMVMLQRKLKAMPTKEAE